MLDFETYLKSNCNVPDAAACGVEYNHTKSTSMDRKTRKPITNHTVTVKTTWTDRDARVLRTNKLVFQNDALTKASEKNIGTMSTVELNNKFRAAKSQIIRELIREKQEKINQLQMDVMMMSNYINTSVNGSTMFQQQPNTIEPVQQQANVKHAFDM